MQSVVEVHKKSDARRFVFSLQKDDHGSKIKHMADRRALSRVLGRLFIASSFY